MVVATEDRHGIVDHLARSAEGADPTSASDRLVERLTDGIVGGEFSPGERLTEVDLARRFGVSRAPLREALFRLAERQLIERSPYAGMRVALLQTRTIEELYEVRGVLEGLACRRAAAAITEPEVASLRALLAARGDALRRGAGLDMRALPTIGDLHDSIARISGNAALERLLNGEIWRYMRALYRRWARSTSRADEGLSEHAAIVEALAARDGELAELLMRRHVASSLRGLMAARAQAGLESGS